jgi:adenosylmethionine-8-amino-7-oxononanoate aminotransferase
VEFVSDRTRRRPGVPSQTVAERAKAEALVRGLVIYPCTGTVNAIEGDHLIVAPPYGRLGDAEAGARLTPGG